MIISALCYILAYLFGSVPFGFVIGKIKGVDLRNTGSGNIGATNVARALGKKWALLTFILDGMKGFMPVYLIQNSNISYFQDVNIGILATLSVIGHIFPIWLKFRGGKGVATTIVTYFAMNASIGIAIILCWISVFLFTKISSLSAIIAISLGLLLSITDQTPAIMIFSVVTYVLIIAKHIPNIKRLLNKSESKF